MVQFEDGSVMAQLGLPNMKIPISYALSYPKRLKNTANRLDFSACRSLTFEQPDTDKFRNLAFAFEAISRGGNMPCILNAANEIAVDAFLKGKVGFLQMSDIIEQTIANTSFVANPAYEDYVMTDAAARRIATQCFTS